MSRTIVGLDLGETALSAVVVRSTLRSKTLVSWARIPLHGDLSGEGLDRALDSLAAQIAVKNAVWVGGLPSGWVSLRNLRVPFGEPKKIRQILPYEMEPLVASPIDGMIVDFHFAGPAGGHSADIVAAAAQIDPIKDYLDRLARRGIKPAWMTAGNFGLPCCLAAMVDTAHNSVCVQVAAGWVEVAAIVAGRLGLVHRFAAPTIEPQRATVRMVWLQQAISMVEAFGLGRFAPDCIWIGPNDAGAIDTDDLARQIDPVAVRNLDLVRDLDRLQLEPTLRDWPGGSLDRALALALMEAHDIGRINFRRGPLAPKRIWEEHKGALAATVAAAALVAGLGLTGVVLDVTQKQARVKAIDRQMATVFGSIFTEGAKMVDPVGQAKGRIEALRKQARFGENHDGSQLVLDILADISTGIAPTIDISVNRLEVGTDSATLSGDTATFDAVDEIKQKLQAAASFKEVSIASTSKDKTGNRVQFKLQMQLR